MLSNKSAKNANLIYIFVVVILVVVALLIGLFSIWSLSDIEAANSNASHLANAKTYLYISMILGWIVFGAMVVVLVLLIWSYIKPSSVLILIAFVILIIGVIAQLAIGILAAFAVSSIAESSLYKSGVQNVQRAYTNALITTIVSFVGFLITFVLVFLVLNARRSESSCPTSSCQKVQSCATSQCGLMQ